MRANSGCYSNARSQSHMPRHVDVGGIDPPPLHMCDAPLQRDNLAARACQPVSLCRRIVPYGMCRVVLCNMLEQSNRTDLFISYAIPSM